MPGVKPQRRKAPERDWGAGTITKAPLKSGGVAWRAIINMPGKGKISRQFRSKSAAEAWLSEQWKLKQAQTQWGIKPQQPKDTISLGQLFENFLSWANDAHKPSTLETEISRAKQWLEYLGQDTPIGEITKAQILEILREIAERASGSTANRYLALLRKAFNWAVERDYLENNPLTKIKQYRESPSRTRWLTSEKAQDLLKECQRHPRLYMFVAIGLYTGMRQGEIARLRWRDIDFEGETITIPDSKTGNPRTIPLEDSLKQLLRAWPQTGELVLGEYRHRKAFEGALKRAGIADFTFHDLRHTYASWKVQAGVPLMVVKELLGHKTLAMVKRYAHLAPEHLASARGKGILRLEQVDRFWIVGEKGKEIKSNADKVLSK